MHAHMHAFVCICKCNTRLCACLQKCNPMHVQVFVLVCKITYASSSPRWLLVNQGRYVRYTCRWRKKCTVLHRIQWRIWWCTEFGDKFSTDFFTVLKKAYFSMTILSLNSVMIYWRLIHHWIRWWKLVYFLLWFFGSPNSVHMFALKLMKMILVKILAPNSVKNYVLHWIPWQIKNTSHAHNVCF